MILSSFFQSRTARPLGFFLLGLVVGVLFWVGAFFLSLYGLQRAYEGKVYPKVSVFSLSVAGKNAPEVEQFLAEKNSQLAKQKIIFSTPGRPEKTWEILAKSIDFSIDIEGTKKELFSQGRTGKGVGWLKGIYKLFSKGILIGPKYSLSSEKLKKINEEIAKEVERPAKDALFEFVDGWVVSFQPSEDGFSLDREAMSSLIIGGLTKFSQEEQKIELPVGIVKPKITTSQSNGLGIKEKIGEGESFFKDSIPSRVHNIILASSKMHGIVVAPEDTFSFAEKIGEISEATGYEKAYVIKEKRTILEDGGGVCQVSTTMFRAVLSAGLPIVERQAHYYRVGFYEQGGYPPGLDATVYPPSPDFKFKNDTPNYILIQTVVDKAQKRLAFQIYGTADGRKVEMTKPIVHSQTPPPADLYVDEPSLPVGVVKKLDAAHWGAKVSFKRTVWNADGSIKEEKTFWSNYTPWPAVYQRGVGQ